MHDHRLRRRSAVALVLIVVVATLEPLMALAYLDARFQGRPAPSNC